MLGWLRKKMRVDHRSHTVESTAPDRGAGCERAPISAIRTPSGSQSGFTLVEMVISMFVMMVAIGAVIGMQTFAMQANTIANQLSVASTLAQQVLEDIIALPASDSTVTTSGTYTYSRFPVSPATTPPTYTTTITDPNSGTYSATYTTLVGTSANGVAYGVSCITVTINYTFKSKVQKSVSMVGFKRLT